MMTETPDMSSLGRGEAMEIMFEYFGVPSLCIGNSALMSLYGIGQVWSCCDDYEILNPYLA